MAVKIKEMPFSEKYKTVIDELRFEESFNYPFVQKNLGDKALSDLKKSLKEGFKPVNQDASFEQKYETSYSNWIWLGVVTFEFIRRRLGEEGMVLFERANVDALKKKNAGFALNLLSLIRFFSPGTAFSMTAKNMAYLFQWLTPYTIPELSKSRLLINMPRCKILDYPDTEDICVIGCQKIYPTWVAEQFKVNMQFKRQGKSCSMTLVP